MVRAWWRQLCFSLYHVVGFAAIEINDPNVHDHILVGSFRSMAVGAGVIEPSAGLGETSGSLCGVPMVYGVTLWR